MSVTSGYASRLLPASSLPANAIKAANGEVRFLTTGNKGLYEALSDNVWSRLATALDVMEIFRVDSYAQPGDADDGAAIIRAAAALQATGGGILYFSHRVYNIYTVGTAYTNLAVFSNLNGVWIIGNGATLAEDVTRVFGVGFLGRMFLFTGCSNVHVAGFTVTGPRIAQAVPPFQDTGPDFFIAGRTAAGQPGCTNLSLSNVDIQGGCVNSCSILGDVGDPAVSRTKNIAISNFHVANCVYGPAFENSGDNVTIDGLDTENLNRSYFPYGVRNHRVRLRSLNHVFEDILIASGGAYGGETSGIDVDYTNIGSTDVTTTTHIILHFRLGGAGIIQNVRIRTNLNFTAAPGVAVKIGPEAGAAGLGHICQNIEISGFINGAQIIDIGNALPFGAGDTIRNIDLTGIVATNAAAWVIDLTHFTDNLLFRNILSGSNITVNNKPANSQVMYLNVASANINAPILPTGAGKTVDNVITALQTIGLVTQA